MRLSCRTDIRREAFNPPYKLLYNVIWRTKVKGDAWNLWNHTEKNLVCSNTWQTCRVGVDFMLHFVAVQIVCEDTECHLWAAPAKGSDEMKILTVCNRGAATRLHFLHQSQLPLKVPRRSDGSTEHNVVFGSVLAVDLLFLATSPSTHPSIPPSLLIQRWPPCPQKWVFRGINHPRK